MKFLECIADAFLDSTAEELIGAMLIVVGIAVLMSALCVLRSRKASPSPTFVGGLVLGAGASCMVLATGYFRYAETVRIPGPASHLPFIPKRPIGGLLPDPPPPPRHNLGIGWSSGVQIVLAVDENHDGRITVEEASQLVRKADTDGDGSVNSHDIDRLVMSGFRPPPRQSTPTTSGMNERPRPVQPPAEEEGAGNSDDVNRPEGVDE
jgi:EF hand